MDVDVKMPPQLNDVKDEPSTGDSPVNNDFEFSANGNTDISVDVSPSTAARSESVDKLPSTICPIAKVKSEPIEMDSDAAGPTEVHDTIFCNGVLSFDGNIKNEAMFSYVCNQCGGEFVEQVACAAHFITDHFAYLKTPLNESQYLMIIRTPVHDSNDLSYICAYCSPQSQYSAKCQRTMKNHIRAHFESSKHVTCDYNCDKCIFSCRAWSHLIIHKSDVHSLSEQEINKERRSSVDLILPKIKRGLKKKCRYCPFLSSDSFEISQHDFMKHFSVRRLSVSLNRLSSSEEQLLSLNGGYMKYGSNGKRKPEKSSRPRIDTSEAKRRKLTELKLHIPTSPQRPKTVTVPVPPSQLSCKDCPFGTNEEALLKKHKKHHKQSFTYKCPRCTYSSNSLSFLNNSHVPLHDRSMVSSQASPASSSASSAPLANVLKSVKSSSTSALSPQNSQDFIQDSKSKEKKHKKSKHKLEAFKLKREHRRSRSRSPVESNTSSSSNAFVADFVRRSSSRRSSVSSLSPSPESDDEMNRSKMKKKSKKAKAKLEILTSSLTKHEFGAKMKDDSSRTKDRLTFTKPSSVPLQKGKEGQKDVRKKPKSNQIAPEDMNVEADKALKSELEFLDSIQMDVSVSNFLDDSIRESKSDDMELKTIHSKEDNVTKKPPPVVAPSFTEEFLDDDIPHIDAPPPASATTCGPPRLLCSFCPYISASENDFTIHLKHHISDQSFKCPHCSYATARRDVFMIHKQLHLLDIGSSPSSVSSGSTAIFGRPNPGAALGVTTAASQMQRFSCEQKTVKCQYCDMVMETDPEKFLAHRQFHINLS